ncbi:MAG: outer membrane lipoprotein-sorting protein [Acidobacteria bacterium]|nr:MAG: outer membrane lipoprotein-sorting protein [Acidobacteriota bacterium]
MILFSVLVVAQLSTGAIVARVKEGDLKIQDLRAKVHLEIRTGDDVKTRRFDLSMKRDGVNYRALIVLAEPRAMAGTKFLVHAERGKRNKEWAYFPDLDLVRPILGKNQDDRFLGSDITYADLAGGAHLDDLRHRLIGEETVEGEPCYVLEGTPRHRIVYGKLRGYVQKSNFITVQAAFFDHDGVLVKEAFLTDVRDLGDGVKLAHRIEVRDYKMDSTTVLTFSDVEVNQGLSEDAFRQDALSSESR